MSATAKHPAAANIPTVRSRGYKIARLATAIGVRIAIQTGSSQAKTFSIPSETAFSREIFLQLQSLPDKAPDVSEPEDAGL